MLSRPQHGWTTISIGSFKDRASYMTDVSTDCLDAFIYGTEKGVPVTIYFDAEGYGYYVVVDEFICYVIKEAGEDEHTDTLYRIEINR